MSDPSFTCDANGNMTGAQEVGGTLHLRYAPRRPPRRLEAMDARIATYREFWPYYLREHARPEIRAIHFAGTFLATGSLLALIATGNSWFVASALIGGYGPAWVAHFFVEHNRPATFRYPLWSLVSDYRMAWSWLSGGLARELAKAGVPSR